MADYSWLIIACLISYTAAQQCATEGSGPVINGLACPPGTTEATSPSGAQVCCATTDLVITTIPPPATTAPAATTAVGATTAAGGTTASSATGAASSGTTGSSSSCADLLNPRTGVSDCPKRASLCTNSLYLDVMKVQCPKTCNLCGSSSGSTSSSSCVDKTNPQTGVSDCPKRIQLCTNSLYRTLMQQQCPKTCGFCSSSATSAGSVTTAASSTCADLVNPQTGVSDCARNIALCSNTFYSALMTQQCPKTCGRCSSATGSGSTGSATTSSASGSTVSSGTCVDKTNPATGVSECPQRISLCTNSMYRTLMQEQCPRSCGFCTSG